eukprot:TRINITY_DN26369_c0_g1_i2.p1 TRINITY_DN26369_c0_g1~~TRINITY_DN26369_c0_g1_i2.p1  ORF type:complete len:128 (-),score=64.29 TRINITY_DN26369_c0_g1_i2:48-431(-)
MCIRDRNKLFHSSIREPMGKSYNHGLYVPAYAKEPDYRFGCSSDRNEWGAKELCCPPPDPEEGNPEHKRMYKISHSAYGVGEQRSRNYDWNQIGVKPDAVSYTHLRAHETVLDLVCRLLLEKKKKKQ